MKTKKIFFAAFAMAALALSCTREAEVSDATGTGQELTITATWAEGEMSRTALQGNGKDIWWTPGEKINAFYGNSFSGEFTSTNTTPAQITTFQGVLNILIGGEETAPLESDYFAVYPYDESNTCDGQSVTLTIPNEQTATSGSFADKFFPAVAKSKTPSLAFWNVCGGARFSVVAEGVQRVVFRSNDGSPMTGTVRIGFGEDRRPVVEAVSEAMDSIVITAPLSGFTPGANYFATMLPQVHGEGLTVTLYTASQRAVKTINKSITVKRSVFGTLDAVDNGLVYEDYDNWFGPSPGDIIEFVDSRIKNHCVAAFDINGDGELSYGEAAAVTDISSAFTSMLYTSFDEFRYFTGVTSIPANWFKDRARLKHISLPAGVTSIGSDAFTGCTALEKIGVGTTIISSLTMSSVFPDAYTTVRDWELIPSGNEWTICAQAFENCSGLTSLLLPEGLTAIGANAFLNCNGLKKITIPSLRSWLGVHFDNSTCSPFYSSQEGHLYIGENERTSLVLPEGLAEVGAYSFYHCSCITDVTFPISLQSVGDYAFYGCSGMERVYVPSIESWLGLHYASDNNHPFYSSQGGHLYVEGAELRTVQIPKGTTTIGFCTFYNCTGLEEISLPVGLASIGEQAFYRCTGLKKVNVSNLSSWLNISYGNLCSAPFNASGEGRLFINGTELTEPVIPEELTSFKPYAFYNCTGLRRMVLEPTTPPSIGTDAMTGTQCFFIVWDECLGAYKTAWSSLAPRILPESTQFEENWVDLGLSVKWGTFNLGAQSESASGFYYAWGETVPKNSYNWSGYIWCGGSSTTLTKYCSQVSYGSNGFTDEKTILDLGDDAAAVTLGDKWRLPTFTEWEELMDNCTWSWTTVDGASGMLLTGKKSGYTSRTLFLPAAGMQEGANTQNSGSLGKYWSSSRAVDSPYATNVTLGSGGISYSDDYRYRGLSVRPVYGDLIRVNGVTLDYIKLTVGESATLCANISPSDASEKTLLWSTSDATVATVTSEGVVNVIRYGTAVITVRTLDGDYSATLTIENIYSVDTPEMVDLGLSVKWASFNLGASSPEGYGDYFAWGETSPKNSYTWENYLWCKGSNTTLTKYCNWSSYGYNGFTDGKTILDPEDDAAAVNLGGKWRMATYAEGSELITKCTWKWTTQNGVNGRLVTGPNGNSIFLPAAGYRTGTSLSNAGSGGYDWSSSLGTEYPYRAQDLYFGSVNVYWNYDGRYFGLSVRPVSE